MLKNMEFSMKAKGFEPSNHKVKEGTPTMGGIMIVIAGSVSTLLWADLSNAYVWITIFTFVSYGVIGFIDDYIKTVKKNPKGLSARMKFFGQVVTGCIAISLIITVDKGQTATVLAMPFLKRAVVDLSMFYFIFALFVIVGTSNAVNITDGLDGLAIAPSVISFGTLSFFVYFSGHSEFANYLNILYIKGSGELAVFCGAMVGAGLGFLWFNAFPANIFMGDVGSLSIGGAMGIVSVISKHEIILAIVGGVFVMETISVILQVGFFKATHGKRLFRMAPIHHHFELKGWSETKITVRFWIISFVLALIALSTLKLR
jgi:phospho-N-acetylmuramoyl-pentapeptide-transferase